MNIKNFWLACLTIVFCRILAAYILPTFDDAFITFRYGEHLINGDGLVYNLHEKIMGTTAPLFAILSIIPLFFSIAAAKFFVVFNLLCDLGTLYLVYRFFLSGSKTTLIIFSTFFAFDPIVNRISVGGMEANLFLFLSLLGIVLYLNQKKGLAFGLLSLIYFLRPEALILLFVMGCYEIAKTKRIPWKYIILSFILLAIPLYIIYIYYGQVLPQSVIAKSATGRNPISNLVNSIFFRHPFNYLIFPLAVYGIIKRLPTKQYLLVSGIWMICYAGAYFLRGPLIWTWYIYSVEVVQLVFASMAIVDIAATLRLDLSRYRWLMALPLFSVFGWIIILYKTGRSGIEVNVYGGLKKDFERMDNRNKIFFADDIGALGYYSGGYIYDNQMLVTPQASKFKNAHDRIISILPDYLYLYTDSVYLGMIRKDSVLSKKYTFLKRYAPDGEKDLPAVFDKNAVIVYKQDYMLFKKNN